MNIATQSRSVAKVRGLWLFDAFSPVRVSDPLRVRKLLGLPELPKSERARLRAERGVLPLSFIQRNLPTLTPGVRREVERLLSGSRKLWSHNQKNIVVNQGLNDLLGVTLSGTTQDTTWFVGLMSATPTAAAGDTLASHGGWTEVTAYDETNRVAWVDGGEASQSITNSASPAVFTINANGTTMGGGFLGRRQFRNRRQAIRGRRVFGWKQRSRRQRHVVRNRNIHPGCRLG